MEAAVSDMPGWREEDEKWLAEQDSRSAGERSPKPDPSQGKMDPEVRAMRERWRRQRTPPGYFAEQDRLAWEEVRNRPADWVCPDGESCDFAAWIASDAPCGQCVPGRCVEGVHRVAGEWTPNADNTAWHFTPKQLPGETDDEFTARRLAARSPAMRRSWQDNELLTAFWADKGEPVASVYCRAHGENQTRCDRRIANLYLVGRTYVIADGNHYTFQEGRTAHLNTALTAREYAENAREKGNEAAAWMTEGWANANEAAANVKEWPLCLTLDQRPKGDPLACPGGAPFDYLLAGCQHHGNAALSYAWLREVAKRRKPADVDPQSRRVYALESEMPSAEG